MPKLKNFVRRYTSVSAVIDILARKQLAILLPETWDDRNDRHFMALYKEKRDLKRLSGLCATAATETYHHWRVFAGTSDGACLIIKRNEMESHIDTMDGIRFGEIEYLKIDGLRDFTSSDDDVNRLPFVKRAAFADECECRVVFESSEDGPEIYQLHIQPSWISAVQLNPWMPMAFVESITQILRGLDGFNRLE